MALGADLCETQPWTGGHLEITSHLFYVTDAKSNRIEGEVRKQIVSNTSAID